MAKVEVTGLSELRKAMRSFADSDAMREAMNDAGKTLMDEALRIQYQQGLNRWLFVNGLNPAKEIIPMTEAEWLASDDPARMLRFIHNDGRGVDFSNPEGTAFSHNYKISDRKLRLFACACCRQVWHLLTDDVTCQTCEGRGSGVWRDGVFISAFDKSSSEIERCPSSCDYGRINRGRRAVEVAERFADGLATSVEASIAYGDAFSVGASNMPGPSVLAAECCGSRLVQQLRNILQTRHFDGTQMAALLRDIVGNPFRPVKLPTKKKPHPSMPLVISAGCPWITTTVTGIAQAIYDDRTFDRLPILADALEEAGCTDAAILNHCRQQGFQWQGIVRGRSHFVERVDFTHVRGCRALDLILGKE